ncbi:hypothetical protein DRN69_01315 [Candidatus Pacearchaeota archaeon]|nr:MAG: hypothetical protein DRN69_01315 [Candidatus Pacearchaeota archaeon]
MNKQEIIEGITQKKEYSQLPKKDVEIAFSNFDKKHYTYEEKIKKTRNLLRKVFSGFSSSKLLLLKNKSPEWILRKHISTRERFFYYKEIYKRILFSLPKEISIIDLGAGVNGFSYNFLKKALDSSFVCSNVAMKQKYKINYIGIEAMGQFVDLMNKYFKKEKINGKAIHLSLFELEKIKKIIREQRGMKVVLLFKVIDSLEILKRDYSKKLIKEIAPFTDRLVISFAMRSIGKRQKFRVKRKWIIDFIKENFKVLDDFEKGGERYIVFEKKQQDK